MQGARFLHGQPKRFDSDAGPLEEGDCLTSKEFLRRREALSHPAKIELIDGIVRIESDGIDPQSAGVQAGFLTCLQSYAEAAPGTEFSDSAAVILLDRENIIHPDGVLRIAQACGGRTGITEKRHIVGAPELIAEVMLSRGINDLREKLSAFRRNGVPEYVVWRLPEKKVEWFQLERGEYVLNLPGPNNVLCSRVFPGLCLNVTALAANETVALRYTLQSGFKRPEHKAFVERLAKRKPGP